MKDIVEKYKRDGYYILKNLYSEKYCDELKDYVNTLEIKRYIPFSNIAWGWGSLLNKGSAIFLKSLTHKKITGILCALAFSP